MPLPAKDITGQRFGRLVVESMVRQEAGTRCFCRCDCGSTKVVYQGHLRNGSVVSCGPTCPTRIENLAGQKFGRWTVLNCARRATKREQSKWNCRCDCGTERTVNSYCLRRGRSLSCGCYSVEVTNARSTKHGAGRRGAETPEFIAWMAAKGRCLNPGNRAYAHYGGRGITICARWREDFAAFLADMGPRPRGASLDRIDSNGNYEPSNCRWATSKEQGRNRRDCRTITAFGETLCMEEWAERSGVSRTTISVRLDMGWSPDRAVSTPVRRAPVPQDERSQLRRVRSNMLNRCYDPRCRGFKNYGGRGIVVCERWRDSIDAFIADVGPRPSPKHSIDRIDVNGHYEPGNVRWATAFEQNRNKRAA